MSDHIFGQGKGHLSKQVEQAAKAEGATLINYTDLQCNCGSRCRPFTCPKSARHWFTIPDRGEPFNTGWARIILAAVRRAMTSADLRASSG